MIYLKKFENHTAYTAAESGLILPNVSLCGTENHLHYNPKVPLIIDGHEYVEIGGIKWATMDIGANVVGGSTNQHFAWGETQVGDGKPFDIKHYKFSNVYGDVTKNEYTYTKYNNSDGLTVLQLEDDAANAIWGGGWRMPTSGEVKNLLDSTTMTPIFGGNGSAKVSDGNSLIAFCFTDLTDSSKKLYFHMGFMYGFVQSSCDSDGGNCTVQRNNGGFKIWTSSVKTDVNGYAAYCTNSNMQASGDNPYWVVSCFMDSESREYGFPIRPVHD